jgi:hypothetical protein
MNDLLGLIAEAARGASSAETELAKLKDVQAARSFGDKVKYAADILPPHLRPGGHNPIERLHAIASEGIHSNTDVECITIFDECRAVFQYFFRHLEITQKEAEDFAKQLAALTRPSVPSD